MSDAHASDRFRYTRRAALGAMATAGVGFALWPRTPRSRRDVPTGRRVITYWEKWTGPEGQAIQSVVDTFNESQERIWVRRVPVSDIESKAMIAIGGGDPPDVVGLFSYNIPAFAESGSVFAFDEFGGIPAERYAPAIRRLLVYEDRQWAAVNTCYNLTLYYNRRAFRESGLDPDQPPRTLSELAEVASAVVRTGSDGRIQRAGFLPNIPKWWPYFWPVMFGGRLYDKTTNRATTTENVEAYEWVAAIARSYGPDAIRSFSASFDRSYHSAQDPFLSGRVAMVIQGPWIANFARQFAPDFDYGCGPVPVRDDLYDAARPTGLLESDVLMIPRSARDPESAWEFVRFTQRPEIQERLASAHCKSSPMAEVSPGFMEDHPNRYVEVHDAIARSPAVRILPQTRVWPQYRALMLSAFEAIWAGAPVAEELERVQTRVQTLLDLAAKRRRQREAKA